MNALLGQLRGGDWLTHERMRLWAFCVLAVSVIGMLYLVVTSDGLNDFQGRPLGSDFSNVYAAGTYVIEGRATAPFDWPSQYAREKAIFGEKTQFYGWHYPPFFLFIAGALALMPYALALAVWQGVTLALYLLAIRAILSDHLPLQMGSRSRSDREGINFAAVEGSPPGALRAPTSPLQGEVNNFPWLLLALAFPAVLVNIGHGHNGFLTAALIGGALAILDQRPILAGILFGMLSYKPQFGIMIPLVLIATGRWRTFVAAGTTIFALALASTLAFGPDVWRAFLDSMPFTREVVLEAGGTGWHKIQSVFAWVRMWGGSVPLAYAAQGVMMLAAAGALVWLWRSDAAYPLKAAALAIGAILATPYSLDYDMMALAPAIAYLAADGFSRGFVPWEKSALALLWFVPLFARAIAEQAMLPLGVWMMLAVFALTLRRAANDLGVFRRGLPA